MDSIFSMIESLAIPNLKNNKIVGVQEEELKQGSATIMKVTRLPSAFGTDRTHCLCRVIKPLLKMCQFFGLFPVQHNEGTCEMSHSWLAFPALINILWLTSITALSFVLYFHVSAMLQAIVYGTDFYAFSIVYMTLTCTTSTILFVGNFNASDFATAWNKLHKIVNEMGLSNFKKMKLVVYIIPGYLLLEFVGTFVIMLISTGSATEFSKNQQESLPILISFCSFITNFIPNLISGMFVIFLWIITLHFEAITERLQSVLRMCQTETEFALRSTHAASLSILRLQHEHLIHVIHHLEKAFGLQLLGITSATTVGLVSGIYGLIIATQGLAVKTAAHMSGTFGIASIFAGFRLLLILLVSQNLMNKANYYPARILNSVDTHQCNEKVQAEVDKFLRKLGNFPIRITCCSAFQIGTCFIASASSNIVTYVLVLMQFKLED